VSQKTVELVKSFFSNDIAKHAELYMNAANLAGLPFTFLISFVLNYNMIFVVWALEVSRQFNRWLNYHLFPAHFTELPKAHLVSNWASNKKLKVGFMTSDFRKHPMAYLFINMFRLGFSVVLYGSTIRKNTLGFSVVLYGSTIRKNTLGFSVVL
jgi:hypothetical protein